MITVSYKNTFKDLACFMLHCSLRPREVIAMLIVPIAITSHMMYTLRQDYPVYALILTFLIMVSILFIAIFILSFCLNILLVISKSNKIFLCEHAITVNEEKLIEETEFSRSECCWRGVSKITKTHKYIYLFVNRYMAHVIPTGAFSGGNCVDEFVDFCRTIKKEKS